MSPICVNNVTIVEYNDNKLWSNATNSSNSNVANSWKNVSPTLETKPNRLSLLQALNSIPVERKRR